MTKRPIRIDGSIAYVPLTKGYEAIIDAVDLAIIEPFSWSALVKPNVVYAKRSQKINGKYFTIRMHRAIADVGDEQLVDHKNGNGLDNRRLNLRAATNSQNLCNRGTQRNNTSGHVGVTWNKAAGKWQSQIKVKGRIKYLGLFVFLEDAIAARTQAAAKLHGVFAWGAEHGVVFHDEP